MVLEVNQELKELFGVLYRTLVSSEVSHFQESLDVVDRKIYALVESMGFSYKKPLNLNDDKLKDYYWVKLALATRFPGLIFSDRQISFDQYQIYILDELISTVKQIVSKDEYENYSRLIVSAVCGSRTVFGESLNSKVSDIEVLRPPILNFLGDINSTYRTCFLYRSEYVDIMLGRLSEVMEDYAANMLRAVFLSRVQKLESDSSQTPQLFSSIVDEVSNIVFAQVLVEHKKAEKVVKKTQDNNDWLNFYQPALEKDSSLDIANEVMNLWTRFKGEQSVGIDGALKVLSLAHVFWDGYLVALSESKTKIYENSSDGIARLSLSGRLYFRNLLDNISDLELRNLLIITKPYLLYRKEEVKGFFIISERNINFHSQCEQSYYLGVMNLLGIYCRKSLTIDEFIRFIESASAPFLDYYLYEDIEVDELIINMNTGQFLSLPFLERSAVAEVLGRINMSRFLGLDGLFARYLCDYLSEYNPKLCFGLKNTSSRLLSTSI